jgi:hypothetical protein
MRSPRNRTRSRAEKHHYTDRTSAPVHSNAPTHNPGNLPGRDTWGSQQNTNLQLARGGISSYYRSRERGYSA